MDDDNDTGTAIPPPTPFRVLSIENEVYPCI
jgi:hypothetical protein